MKPLGRRAVRIISACLFLTLLAPAAVPVQHPAEPSVPAEAGQAVTKSETRLRKLHLVRPDLIPYPIAYEIYC